MSSDDLHNRPPHASANGDAAADALVDRLTEALRETPVPDGPDEATLVRTLAALRNSAAAGGPPPPALRVTTQADSPKRILTMKTLIKLAAAACIAVLVGLVFLTNPGGRALAFGDVVEHVKQAKSVRYKSLIRVEMPGGKVHTSNATTVIAGNRMRQELPGVVQLMDMDKGETLMLQTDEKQATRMTTRNRPQPRDGQVTSMNLLEHFRSLETDQSKDLGLKKIDGRTLRGFVIQQPGNTMTVWADPKTEEPVRIEAKINMPGVPPSTTVMTDFEWDVPVDPALMTLEVPKGYTASNLELNAAPPAEADLIEGLRALAELNGGDFTRNFGRDGIAEAVKKAQPTMPKGPEQVQKFRTERTPKIVKVARSLSFTTAANGDEWHYAGEGAKLGEAGRAVFWYRPKGSEKYRVINADMTVRDVPADALPDVEAKQITPGTMPMLPATTAPSERPRR